MKSLINFLNEGITIDEIIIKDQKNKNVDIVYCAYDEASLNDICNKYKNVGKYWIDKIFCIATLKNKSIWITYTSKEFKLNTYQPNGDFLEYEDEINYNESYTYKELVDLLEKGETMLIVINK